MLGKIDGDFGGKRREVCLKEDGELTVMLRTSNISLWRGLYLLLFFFFFPSRRRHTRLTCDGSSDVCSSDLLDRHPHVVLVGDRDDHGLDARVGEHRVVVRVGHLRPVRRGDRVQQVLRGVAQRVQLGVASSEERRVGKQSTSGWLPCSKASAI